jgi:hypothetical protein
VAYGRIKHNIKDTYNNNDIHRKYEYKKWITLKLGCRMSIFESRDQVDKAKKRIPIS